MAPTRVSVCVLGLCQSALGRCITAGKKKKPTDLVKSPAFQEGCHRKEGLTFRKGEEGLRKQEGP